MDLLLRTVLRVGYLNRAIAVLIPKVALSVVLLEIKQLSEAVVEEHEVLLLFVRQLLLEADEVLGVLNHLLQKDFNVMNTPYTSELESLLLTQRVSEEFAVVALKSNFLVSF